MHKNSVFQGLLLTSLVLSSVSAPVTAHQPVPISMPRILPKHVGGDKVVPVETKPQETQPQPEIKPVTRPETKEDLDELPELQGTDHPANESAEPDPDNAHSRAIGTRKDIKFVDGKKVSRGTPPVTSWIDPEREPFAVLLCVHGCGLHGRTYDHFAKRMAKAGLAVYALDVRGFGNWQNEPNKRDIDFDGCLYDVHQTMKVLKRAHPDLPVYLVGESMGGAIALREASMFPDQFAGLISSVPAGDRFEAGKTDLKVAAKFLFAPNKKFNIGEQIVRQATEKPELKKEWSEDPLARLHLSPKELLNFKLFCDGNKKAAQKLTVMPVLFLQGTDDKLIKPLSTFETFDALPTSDKQLLAVKNQEHLILEESQFNLPQVNDIVADLLLSWIKRPRPKNTWQGQSAAKLYAEQTGSAEDEPVKKSKAKVSKKKEAQPPQPPVQQPAVQQPSENAILIKHKNPEGASSPAHAPRKPDPVIDPNDEAAANAAADKAAAEAIKKMRQQQRQGNPGN